MIHPRQLLVAVFHRASKQMCFLKSYSLASSGSGSFPFEQTSEILSEEPTVNHRFAETRTALLSSHSTLVPDALFHEAAIAAYLSFTQPSSVGLKHYSAKIPGTDMVHVYAVPESLNALLDNVFERMEVVHPTTYLIGYLLQKNKSEQTQAIYANIVQQDLEVLFADSGNLIIHNRYPFRSTEDLIYFLMLTCDHFHLNPENVRLVLSGDIEPESNAHGLICKYIRNVTFAERPSQINYVPDFDRVPAHQHLSLYCMHG